MIKYLVLSDIHLGNKRNKTEEIIRNLDTFFENYGPGKTNKPVILLGDMNCIPEEVTIANFKENWDWVSAKENTYPCPNATKCIDFIFVLKNGVSYTKGESHSVFNTTTTDVKNVLFNS